MICTQDPHSPERGIPTYARELALALERSNPDLVTSYLLNPDGPFPRALAPLLSTGKLTNDPLRVLDPESILHITSPFDTYIDPIALVSGHRGPVVVSMYDVIPYIYADHYLPQPKHLAHYMARAELVRQADLVLCISEATARDTIEFLDVDPSRVRVVGTGVAQTFRPAQDREVAFQLAEHDLPALRPDFLLFTGGIDYRKNIDGLFRAFALLPRDLRHDHQLVLVCRVDPSAMAALMALAHDLEIADDLLITGFVSDNTLLHLYQSAHLFIFPSTYEGFGLPVAEAIACGTPAIVGDNSSLVEIVKDPAARFDSTDPHSIAVALQRGLVDDAFRASLLDGEQQTFSWDAVAAATIAAYDEVQRRPVPRPRSRARPLVALLTPMPPAPSGVADYSERLANELVKRADIHIFSQADADRTTVPGAEWSHYRALPVIEALVGGFDEIIFCIGNSHMHLDILELLSRLRRGTALVHDVHLHGLYSVAATDRPSVMSNYARDTLNHRSSGVLPMRHGSYPAHTAGYFDFNRPLIRDVAHSAERVIVHSLTAASMARLELPPGSRAKVGIAPFGHLAPGPLTTFADRDVVVSAGIVSPAKQSQKTIAAFFELVHRFPELTFVVLGESHMQVETQEWEDRAATEGVSERMIFTGRVNEADYRGWLARARLGIQLRETSKGESSAAIADCMSAAVPVIASAVGSALELARECLLVPTNITATELAEIMDRVLRDPTRLLKLSEAGLAHARARSFERAAVELLSQIA